MIHKRVFFTLRTHTWFVSIQNANSNKFNWFITNLQSSVTEIYFTSTFVMSLVLEIKRKFLQKLLKSARL